MVLTHRWWTYLTRGLLAMIFGIILLAWPEITTKVVIVAFGIFLLIEGVFATLASIGAGENRGFAALLLLGLVSLLLGVLAIARPGAATVVILYVIAIWAFVHGILEMIAAFEMPPEVGYRWLVGIAGFLSLVVGLLLAIFPFIGIFTLVLIIGIYAILAGIALVITSFFIRSYRGRPAMA